MASHEAPLHLLPRMMRTLLSGCAIATLVGASSPAALFAQDIPSPYRYVEKGMEASIFAAPFSADAGLFGFGPRDGLLLGARWSVEIGGPIAFEAVGSYITADRDVVDPLRSEGNRVIGVADQTMGSLDARLRVSLTGRRSWHGVTPFLMLGGGMLFDLDSSQPLDSELADENRYDFGTEFSGVFGAGLRIFLTDRIAIRSDAYITIYQIDTPDGFFAPALDLGTLEESEWVSSKTLSLGLAYLF